MPALRVSGGRRSGCRAASTPGFQVARHRQRLGKKRSACQQCNSAMDGNRCPYNTRDFANRDFFASALNAADNLVPFLGATRLRHSRLKKGNPYRIPLRLCAIFQDDATCDWPCPSLTMAEISSASFWPIFFLEGSFWLSKFFPPRAAGKRRRGGTPRDFLKLWRKKRLAIDDFPKAGVIGRPEGQLPLPCKRPVQ